MGAPQRKMLKWYLLPTFSRPPTYKHIYIYKYTYVHTYISVYME